MMPFIRSAEQFARLCLQVFVVTYAVSAFAGDGELIIVKSEGEVWANDRSGKTVRVENASGLLPSNNMLQTGANGRAVVRFGTAGYVVLNSNSKIEINKANDGAGLFRHITGMVYYAMNKIKGGQQPLGVRTKTATIGIRGTRFLVVDEPGRGEIGMRKGQVSVTSLEGEFEIHKKAEQSEFEAYKQNASNAIAKEKSEFEAYKANAEKEFVEFKREFNLGANRMASFDGKHVEDKPLSEESRMDMENIETYADTWLNEIHD
jgi:hypothetical protein